MLFRYGWLMSNLDFIIHTTGAILLISSGLLWLRTDGKLLNRLVGHFFILVLCVMLVEMFMHLLPNALANFIYGTQKYDTPNKLTRS
jgi:hypothetical protein